MRVVYVLVSQQDLDIGGDTQYYHEAARLLADGEGFLNPFFSTPDQPYQSADHPPLYQLWLAGFSFVGVDTPTGHLLASTLLGAATVLVCGLAGREIAGPRTGLVAAALAAVYPNVWTWDGMLLSETMAILTVTLTLWLAYRYRRRPTTAGAIWLGAAAAAAALSRAELILLTAFVVAPVVLLTHDVDLRGRVRRLAAAALAAVVLLGPWVGYNLARFEEPVYLSVGFEITLASATCDRTYAGEFIGYWTCDLDEIREDMPDGLDQSEEVEYFREAALDYIDEHRDRILPVVLARWGRIVHVFRPFQQARLDWFPEGREQWAGEAGVASFYLLVPLAIAGAFVLRRRRTLLFPLLAPPVIVWITITVTFATTRYRATAETAIVLLAAVALAALLPGRSPTGAVPADEHATESPGHGPDAPYDRSP